LTAIGMSGCGSSSLDTTTAAPADPCDAAWRAHLFKGTPPNDMFAAPSIDAHATALRALDISAVMDDLKTMFTNSHPCWPADFVSEENPSGNYGPMFIRLAWHCSGSYRNSDGRGGCGGGRHRFEPERSWEDNTNLDKARALLSPIKDKYGDALSWGDLIIAAGTTALRSMGTPITQLCFGRIDQSDGTSSLDLGPSVQQETEFPCDVNGDCQAPLGSTTVGLIYVNPEGPVTVIGGSPDPSPSKLVAGVRDSFDRMGHDDRATVALIGGGHAFGKVHGACDKGPGKSPLATFAIDQDDLPWLGECGGNGRGLNTFTSGFEGQWTLTPLVWSNQFFKDLDNRDWDLWTGPGGHAQWRLRNATENETSLMRLTSDMALMSDRIYREIVHEFASDVTAFDEAFDSAWFDLTTTHGAGVWSEAAKCDTGSIPAAEMLDTDILV